jgi:ribosomal-protein-alanine N-acetyltransferase
MAEVIAANKGWEARSRGLAAYEGADASMHAVEVADELGFDLWTHKARLVREDDMEWADVVYGLTMAHVSMLRSTFPAYADKVKTMPGGDVPDPVGGTLSEYRECAARLQEDINMFFTIRLLVESDAVCMAELEKQCFSLPWSEQTIRADLNNPISRYLGAFDAGRLVGYAGIQMVVDEGYITNIATAPDMRRKGIADTLLREMLSRAKQRGLRFATLEVRESNLPAQGLYEKHGFIAKGKRKGYYEKPEEDAIIMTRTFLRP